MALKEQMPYLNTYLPVKFSYIKGIRDGIKE